MSHEIAQLILIGVAVVSIAVWLVGLWFLVVSYRKGMTATECPSDHFGYFEQWPKNCLLGSVDVDGQPGALLEKAVSLLVKQGSFVILEKTKDRLVFEQSGTLVGQPKQGQARFMSLGSGRSRIDYLLQAPSYRWLLWLGGFFQACGLVALIVGGWVIYTFCVQSPDPDTRVQTIQMVQVVHFLWPPFLCGALYRQRKRVPREGMETLLRNLPFYEG